MKTGKNMENQEKILRTLRKGFPHLKNNYQVKRLGLFGSFAKGKETRSSDIDLIVEFKNPIGLNFVEFAEYIENLLGRKVDILTPEGIKSIRIKQVARDIKRGVIYV